jgi:predicted nicotinamide N-methyase
MQIPSHIEVFHFADVTIEARVPSATWIQQQYLQQKTSTPFPYWAKVWPASRALCQVMAAEPQLVKGKQVLELAAGLGLPSLLASRFAASVTASDYLSDAVEMIQQSVDHNRLNNMHCCLLDWNKLDPAVTTELLLLSDINYDPASFDLLYCVIEKFIAEGTCILLSTPQRLAGKPFMERLIPWRRKMYGISIAEPAATVFTSVWLLAK